MKIIERRRVSIGWAVAQIAISWILGSLGAHIFAAVIGPTEFSLFAVYSAMAWFGLLLVPLFVIIGVPTALFLEFLSGPIAAGATLVILVLSAWTLFATRAAEEHDVAFLVMIGATGLVWAAINFIRLFLRRGMA